MYIIFYFFVYLKYKLIEINLYPYPEVGVYSFLFIVGQCHGEVDYWLEIFCICLTQLALPGHRPPGLHPPDQTPDGLRGPATQTLQNSTLRKEMNRTLVGVRLAVYSSRREFISFWEDWKQKGRNVHVAAWLWLTLDIDVTHFHSNVFNDQW